MVIPTWHLPRLGQRRNIQIARIKSLHTRPRNALPLLHRLPRLLSRHRNGRPQHLAMGRHANLRSGHAFHHGHRGKINANGASLGGGGSNRRNTDGWNHAL